MNFFRFTKLIRLRNKNDRFYWLIIFLVFIAGVLFEARFQMAKTISYSVALFLSAIENNQSPITDFFTTLSGLGTLLGAFIYFNWKKIKRKHDIDDCFHNFANAIQKTYRLATIENKLHTKHFETILGTSVKSDNVRILISVWSSLELYLSEKEQQKLNNSMDEFLRAQCDSKRKNIVLETLENIRKNR
ncbi:hypothetical protein ORJ66_06400 [Pseudoalteromonas tunicata]|uniref:hypothetical protein n=1 Tax=Pseudoalteromonas tunicata TaxID=314281 RepID=UPI00273F8673|nr:hypothetical protein [Pseudoalteromonas tunicata]MDP5212671.1 hypothetical protein [Pseudoalteromonas tunicata]